MKDIFKKSNEFNIIKEYINIIVPSVVEGREYYISCSDVDWGDNGGVRKKLSLL